VNRSTQPRALGPRLWLGAAVVLAAGLWLGQRSLDVNLQQACLSGQWPEFERCASIAGWAPGADADVIEVPPEQAAQVWQQVRQEVQRLRAHVARNPGDAWAVSELVRYVDLPADVLGVDGQQLLSTATQVAPQHTLVQQQLARLALERSDWAAAVPPLVRLSRQHGDQEATRTLARMLAAADRDPALLAALRQAQQADPRWPEAALRAMPGLKLPMAPALPLVADLALAGELRVPTGLLVIRQLKAEGHWLDAHALWQRLWNRPVPLLFNGDFEQAFVRDGFDWVLADENPQRAGVRAERIGQGERGQVLRLQFTGRPLRTPLLRQDMFVPAGNYRLEGEHRSLDLRSSGGLTWVLSCANGGRELARSAPLEPTGRDWRSTQMAVTVPADCPGVTLALQPAAAYEARAGLRGEVWLDNLKLLPAASGAGGGGAAR